MTGPDGAVAQVEVGGLIAAAYDHYDSRAGDPQLHTHVVVSNKVQTVYDGKWRSLDGRPMHAAVVALSEHYNAVLADQLTRTLGLGWDQRDRGRDRNPAWEVTGVPDPLIEAFSSRSQAIEVATDRLIEQFVVEYGRRPSATTILKLRAQATLATRPDLLQLSRRRSPPDRPKRRSSVRVVLHFDHLAVSKTEDLEQLGNVRRARFTPPQLDKNLGARGSYHLCTSVDDARLFRSLEPALEDRPGLVRSVSAWCATPPKMAS